MSWEIIILISTGIPALIIQMIYFILDDRATNHTAQDRLLKLWWHGAAGAIHLWMAYAIARIANDWHIGFLMGTLNWLLFDGFINSVVLKKEFWYIGDTAQLDIAQRKLAAFLHIEHRLLSASLKIGSLTISIILIILGQHKQWQIF